MKDVSSHWFFNVYMDGVMKEMKMGRDDGCKIFREWRFPDLVLCGESEEDLRGLRQDDLCRKGVKMNADKNERKGRYVKSLRMGPL